MTVRASGTASALGGAGCGDRRWLGE